MADIKHFDPDTALERAEELFWRNGAATTSIQDVASTTGLNRSSLYATFGGKRELYLAALRRYLHQRAEPATRVLAGAGDGLAAIEAFFAGLIEVRTSGPFAGWGCMIVNAHTGAERADPAVAGLLDGYHRTLCDAFAAALHTARRRGDLPPGPITEGTVAQITTENGQTIPAAQVKYVNPPPAAAAPMPSSPTTTQQTTTQPDGTTTTTTQTNPNP